jgi:hypothetical protein
VRPTLVGVVVGVLVGAGVVGVAFNVAVAAGAALGAEGVIVLTVREATAVGVAAGVVVAEAAAVRNGGWLEPEFPLAASATVVTPTAAASTAPPTRPDIRIRIPGKRDRPAVRNRLDG